MIVNLGDFFHSDNMDNRTRRGGNSLDVDGRFAKVMRVGLRAMRTCVDAALKKHGNVIVYNCIGNHDDHTSLMLSLALAALYENEPRVEICTSPAKFYYHEFGKCLIGMTHGDTSKMPQLSEIMAADKPEEWGRTKHRYWYTGHLHKEQKMEMPGCTAERFRTLAPKDAWHQMMGYRSGRDMKCLVLHKEFGEVERHRVDISMLEKAA